MKNDKIVVEIEKKKLIQIIAIVVVVFLVCIISFAVSNLNSEGYKDNNMDTSGDDILKIATKEAGEISNDERTKPNEVSIDEYLELFKSENRKLVLLSKETCSYCQIATPILENIIYKHNVDINYLNVGNLSGEDTQKLISSSDYFSEGYGTPLIFIVQNGEIVDKIDGLVTKESYMEFFKQYGFME